MSTLMRVSGELTGPASERSDRPTLLLFWLIPLIPSALILLAFVLVRTSFFRTYMDSDLIAAQRVVFDTSNHACDILIFGDSTAMVGVDPEILRRQTGLRTCNIGATGSTLGLVGMDPLNRYLARNPRPKYLVLQFDGNQFVPMPYDTGKEKGVDGLVTVLRYYTFGSAIRQVSRYPSYLSAISWVVYVDGMKRLLKNLTHPGTKENFTQAYVIWKAQPIADCKLVRLPDGSSDPAWVHYLRSYYADAAERVIVDVTPTPSCNPVYPAWSKKLRGLTDNTLEKYPASMFVDGVHLDRAGAIRYSKEVARQILGFERRSTRSLSSTQQVVSPDAR